MTKKYFYNPQQLVENQDELTSLFSEGRSGTRKNYVFKGNKKTEVFTYGQIYSNRLWYQGKVLDDPELLKTHKKVLVAGRVRNFITVNGQEIIVPTFMQELCKKKRDAKQALLKSKPVRPADVLRPLRPKPAPEAMETRPKTEQSQPQELSGSSAENYIDLTLSPSPIPDFDIDEFLNMLQTDSEQTPQSNEKQFQPIFSENDNASNFNFDLPFNEMPNPNLDFDFDFGFDFNFDPDFDASKMPHIPESTQDLELMEFLQQLDAPAAMPNENIFDDNSQSVMENEPVLYITDAAGKKKRLFVEIRSLPEDAQQKPVKKSRQINSMSFFAHADESREKAELDVHNKIRLTQA